MIFSGVGVVRLAVVCWRWRDGGGSPAVAGWGWRDGGGSPAVAGRRWFAGGSQ